MLVDFHRILRTRALALSVVDIYSIFFAHAKVPTSTSLHALERVDPVSLVVGSDEIHTGDSYETRIIHLFMPSCEGSYPYVLVTFHLYLALVIVSLLLMRM